MIYLISLLRRDRWIIHVKIKEKIGKEVGGKWGRLGGEIGRGDDREMRWIEEFTERFLTRYGRGVESRIRDIPKSGDNFPLSPLLLFSFSSVIIAERNSRRSFDERAKGFLRVFSSVKVILGGRIPLTVDRPTGKAVHRCTCGFRVD